MTPDPSGLRVALVHYWLVSMRGGEKVLEQLCELFPQADIFTLVCKPDNISEKIRRHRITTSFLQRLPGGVRYYQNLLPLMPMAVEQFDLRGYDLVISSDTNVTKGVVTGPRTLHVNYCHTPMRYAWDLYHDYLHGSGLGKMKKIAMAAMMNYLRSWDVAAANRVDHFIANSRNVKERIRKHYRRDSEVVYPPVDTEGFRPAGDPADYYLILGQLIPYKRVDLAVQAFNASGRKLMVIGEGSESGRLRALAGPNIEFLGHQPQKSIRKHYASCRALVFPGEEDFGITPVEAQASGRPVIAFGRGGALETVRERETGLFFREPTAEALNAAVEAFESGKHRISSEVCRKNAERFSEKRFRDGIRSFLERIRDAHGREDAWERT